ncbi:hypothetical protein SAMN02910264_01377 [Ruminococcaceae bacterium YAD3003]|nr:hypothetical protein SAMN02910264_01377 [Ruminococcaceae bacterium YAD3003]
MGQIKKRQCPSCGGNLIDDSEKQIYRCSSCGSSYDYDYFREEQLHEMGETYLSRGEVEAAVDAYRLILKKAPHDFLALRGLMLASAYLRDMDGFSRIGDAKHFSYDSKLVGEVLDSASEEDKEYFSEFRKIYVNKQKQIDCNREIKSLHRECESKESFIRLTDNTRYEYYIDSKYGKQSPKPLFISVWILTALGSVPNLIRALGSIEEGGVSAFFAVVGGLALLIGLGINYLILYPRIKMIKKIDADIINLKNDLEATLKKIRELETESEKLSDDIRKAIQDLIRIDRQIVTDSVKEQVPEFGKIKKHQCPSCGGSLRIDSDKQMYHCTFCGSTYDYEYFREGRIHEAGETYLSRGEFMATTETYEFMLKKDPHDFLALRGLMLAAAHLTDMSELDHVNKEFDYDSKIVSQVIENASKEDKEYFTEFAKVYAEKKRMFDCSEEIETLLEEKNKIDSAITQNNKAGLGDVRYLDDDNTAFIVIWVITAILMLLTIVFAKYMIDDYSSNPDSLATDLPFVLSFGGITLFFLIFNNLSYFFSMRKIKKMQKANSELYDEVNKIDDKIRELENESSKRSGDIRRFIHEFVRKDKLIMRDNKSK